MGAIRAVSNGVERWKECEAVGRAAGGGRDRTPNSGGLDTRSVFIKPSNIVRNNLLYLDEITKKYNIQNIVMSISSYA